MHNLDNHEEIEKPSELDLNDTVGINLTGEGKDILRDFYIKHLQDSKIHEDFGFDNVEEYVDKYIIPHYCKNGYYETTLQEIMDIFGSHLSEVSPIPFQKICFSKENSDPKKVTGSGGVIGDTGARLIKTII